MSGSFYDVAARAAQLWARPRVRLALLSFGSSVLCGLYVPGVLANLSGSASALGQMTKRFGFGALVVAPVCVAGVAVALAEVENDATYLWLAAAPGLAVASFSLVAGVVVTAAGSGTSPAVEDAEALSKAKSASENAIVETLDTTVDGLAAAGAAVIADVVGNLTSLIKNVAAAAQTLAMSNSKTIA